MEERLTRIEHRVRVLTWMLGVNSAMVLFVLGKLYYGF
jgi:hypothetical protein